MKYIKGNIYKDKINQREGQFLSFDGEHIEVVVLRKNIDEDIVKTIEKEEVFFQLFSREEIVFLLMKFEGFKWLDMPFVLDKDIKLNSYEDGYYITILLFNPISGKLCAKRTKELSQGLSKALYWALKKQLENPPKNIKQKINKVHAGFSSDEMARLSLGK